MIYEITIPSYTGEEEQVMTTAICGNIILSFTFYWYDEQWYCKIVNENNSRSRSFTLRSNAIYFTNDAIYSVSFPPFTMHKDLLANLTFEVINHAEEN